MPEIFQYCNTKSVTKQTTNNKNKKPVTGYYRNQANLIHTLAPLLPSILILFSYPYLEFQSGLLRSWFQSNILYAFPTCYLSKQETHTKF